MRAGSLASLVLQLHYTRLLSHTCNVFAYTLFAFAFQQKIHTTQKTMITFSLKQKHNAKSLKIGANSNVIYLFTFTFTFTITKSAFSFGDSIDPNVATTLQLPLFLLPTVVLPGETIPITAHGVDVDVVRNQQYISIFHTQMTDMNVVKPNCDKGTLLKVCCRLVLFYWRKFSRF